MIGLFSVWACTGRVYEFRAFKTFDDHAWHRNDSVVFRYTPQTGGLKNFYFYLENDESYPYSNIFLIAKTQTGKKIIIDTLEYRMTDGHGRWLGKKVRHSVENLLVYKTGVKVNENQPVELSLEPATRRIDRTEGDEYLPGIVRVGLIVEPVKNSVNEKEN